MKVVCSKSLYWQYFQIFHLHCRLCYSCIREIAACLIAPAILSSPTVIPGKIETRLKKVSHSSRVKQTQIKRKTGKLGLENVISINSNCLYCVQYVLRDLIYLWYTTSLRLRSSQNRKGPLNKWPSHVPRSGFKTYEVK